jgi:hypothetical protein
MTVQRKVVASCAMPAGGVGANDPLVLVVTPRTVRPDLVVDERREYGAGASDLVWTEVVVRSGKRAALLTVGTPAAGPRPDTSELVAALRAGIGR